MPGKVFRLTRFTRQHVHRHQFVLRALLGKQHRTVRTYVLPSKP